RDVRISYSTITCSARNVFGSADVRGEFVGAHRAAKQARSLITSVASRAGARRARGQPGDRRPQRPPCTSPAAAKTTKELLQRHISRTRLTGAISYHTPTSA